MQDMVKNLNVVPDAPISIIFSHFFKLIFKALVSSESDKLSILNFF